MQSNPVFIRAAVWGPVLSRGRHLKWVARDSKQHRLIFPTFHTGSLRSVMMNSLSLLVTMLVNKVSPLAFACKFPSNLNTSQLIIFGQKERVLSGTHFTKL